MELFPWGCCKEKHFTTHARFSSVAHVCGCVWTAPNMCGWSTWGAPRLCATDSMSVWVFYDSECIPFELHAIYMCAFYFFSKRRGSLCMRANYSCMGALFFRVRWWNFDLYSVVCKGDFKMHIGNVFFSFISPIWESRIAKKM